MKAGKLPKIVLALLISLVCTAVGPAAALAGPAKTSLSPQGGSSKCRIIPGSAFHRSPALPSNATPGSLRRMSASSVLPKTPATKIIPQGGRGDLLAPKSLRGPLYANLPRSSSSPSRFSPSATMPANRSAAHKLTDRIVSEARHYLGTPYSRGGSLETGRATDCSGFVQYIYQKSNIDLPRSSSEQAQTGTVVTRTLDLAKLAPGDLLFFGQGGSHISHVGIYMGDGQMIHCASRRGVIITDLESYQGATFVVAKRLPEAQSSQTGSTGNSSLSRSL